MTALQTEAALNATAAPLPAHIQRLVLTGFMGAGKSTVSRLLADRLGWTSLDLDQHLEDRAGVSIPEIFERDGEAHFRRLESSALASALRHRRSVLALGGGAPEALTNRLLLEQTPGTVTVFLDAPFAVLFDRCMLQNISRPVFAEAVSAEARFNLRRPLYRRLAHLTVPTSDLTPAETIPVILEGLARLS